VITNAQRQVEDSGSRPSKSNSIPEIMQIVKPIASLQSLKWCEYAVIGHEEGDKYRWLVNCQRVAVVEKTNDINKKQ
jgi:hypothetical protein